MSVIIENSMGTISIEKKIIERVAGLATIECYGIVGMSAKNVRDDLIYLLKKEHLAKGVNIVLEKENEITIDLHIIVEYGTNISAISDTLINTVNYHIQEFIGLKCKNINVLVAGIHVNN